MSSQNKFFFDYSDEFNDSSIRDADSLQTVKNLLELTEKKLQKLYSEKELNLQQEVLTISLITRLTNYIESVENWKEEKLLMNIMSSSA